MRRLITPVQYDSTLAGLNEIRPLTLADEVKAGLSFPILNLNPVDNNQPAKGRFLRSDHQGSLLRSLADDCPEVSYEKKDIWLESDLTFTVSFAQKVNYVLGKMSWFELTGTIKWNTKDHWYLIKVISNTEQTFLPFRGQVMYVQGFGVSGVGTLTLYGFY